MAVWPWAMLMERRTRIIDIIMAAHRFMAGLLSGRPRSSTPARLSCCLTRRRQGEGHPAAALRSIDRLRGADGDDAVMDLGHAAGQSEPEPEAARGPPRCPRAVHLIEGREHALALLVRNARPLVADRELDRAVVPLRGEGYGRRA